MKKLTKKQMGKIRDTVIPVLPPAFEEVEELEGIYSGLEMNVKYPSTIHDPKKMYRRIKKVPKAVNYFDKMRKTNKQGGEVAVFGTFLFFCNKFINTTKAMDASEMGLIKNMKMVNYVRNPSFLGMVKIFSSIAKGEKTYSEVENIL